MDLLKTYRSLRCVVNSSISSGLRVHTRSNVQAWGLNCCHNYATVAYTKPSYKNTTIARNANQDEVKEKFEPITVIPNLAQVSEKREDPKHAYHRDFTKMGIIGPLVRAINDLEYEKPTPIQQKVISLALRVSNSYKVVASAQTGTGKTAAFLLPSLQRLNTRKRIEARNIKEGELQRKGALLLVLAPTRELAEQITRNIAHFTKYLEDPVRIASVYGGANEDRQIKQLQQGIDALVATPGRLITLIKEHPDIVDLGSVQTLIVDECDRMLSLGFFADVLAIYRMCPMKVARKQNISTTDPSLSLQVLLFSATLMPSMEQFMNALARKHVLVNLNAEKLVSDRVSHVIYRVHARKKQALLIYLLRRKHAEDFHLANAQVLVFTRTRIRADRLAAALCEEGFAAAAIHTGLSITMRDNTIQSFKEGQVKILVSTDMMARGVDIPELPFVVNFDVPAVPEDFLHRAGRTGRAGFSGTAVTFVSRDPLTLKSNGRLVEINEEHFMRNIENLLQKKLDPMEIPGNFRDIIDEPEKLAAIVESEADQLKRVLETKYEEKRIQMEKTKTERDRRHGVIHEEKNLRRNQPRKPTGSLRDFKEGRYEDVMNSWDEKRALKRGIIVRPIKKKHRKLV